MELEPHFISLSTKFLFINYGGQFSDYRNELNTLLNELNSLDYKNQQITDVKAPIRLIESFVNIPTAEDTLIVKACCLIKTLVNRQKITLPANVAVGQISWLLKCLDRCFYQVVCEVLGTVQLLLRHCGEHVGVFAGVLVADGDGVLVRLLGDPDYKRVERGSGNCEWSSSGEIYLAAMTCLEAMLEACEDGALLEKQLPLVGDAILGLAFRVKPDVLPEASFYSLVVSAFNCLRLVAVQQEEWLGENLGQLLGLAKAYMMYGIPGINQLSPGKVMVSQQGVPEPQHIPMNKGGKVPKTRKTRTPAKAGKGGRNEAKRPTGSTWDEHSRQPYSEHSLVLEPAPVANYNSSNAYRTSDSDFSESESSRVQIDRQKLSKLRLSALTLISSITQNVEKRIMFGYWHALFPDESRTPATVSLLNCVLKDPSPKCRIAAIQATSFMLYKSKPFLIQAESSKKPPTSFTPFSIALGNIVHEMYDMMTQALADESDLSVLTQILKCLTVFIQATPFHRLRTGIVTKFVRFVRILTRHKDPTIKVGALMVMGFLISVNEITPEISAVVGIPRTEIINKSNETRKKNTAEALAVQFNDEEEEYVPSDDEPEVPSTEDVDCASADDHPTTKVCWLLQIALEYLGVTVSAKHHIQGPCSVMPVRMECLQVLSAMTSHYSLLVGQLPLVAEALRASFRDAIPEIKLYAGRVLDLLGHSINTSLLLRVTVDPDELTNSVAFWTAMLPTVTEQIQDMQQNAALRAICCDALGNLGVHVFEKLPRKSQLALVSLLTGCTFDEDSGVGSAAVRALSVYILFPSLRGDLCYVENTVEAILRILRDPNVAARVKASWSLGNITDALVLNGGGDSVERVEDDLLRRVFEAAIVAAGDNDKVRCNSVRTIGNVLRMIREDQLTKSAWVELCQKSIDKLVQNILSSNNVKVKWNACFAAGNLMRNDLMFSAESHRIDWQRQIFPALCQIVINSNNFKVRINSAAALAVVDNRAHYATHFVPIWTALLKALEQSDNLIDYNEYKHRDNLQEQLCLSLSHFLRLANRDDLPAMGQELLPLVDAVRANWDRVLNRILPEKSAQLIEANVRLREMQPLLKSAEAKTAAEMILNCFRQ
uniref:HEAT repeat-containing protein 6 n=1 Tax=Culex tarsalis TaxID=7177 RepID=A0A1Q3FXF7_CULTA